MGSKTFDGVRFQGFTDDHIPPPLHGFYAEVEVLDVRLAYLVASVG